MVVDQRVGVVTGGGTGIGLACATRLVERGVKVLICGRTEETIASAAHQLANLADGDASVLGMVADMGSSDDPTRVIEQCTERFGRIDILVNSAGIYNEMAFMEMTAAAWDETMHINLRGAVLASSAAARQMVVQGGGGRIVHIASINAVIAEPNLAHYGASKAGLVSLTESMAVDLAKHRIATNAVAPGWVRTRLTEDLIASLDESSLARINPLATVASPSEIATVVEFIALDAPSFLTGQTIFVDGGETIMAPMP